MNSAVPIATPTVEPTLGATLRALAANHFPSRFHLALQLSIPFAFQFWSWGWHRSAFWMVAASAFGLWALCEQALTGNTEGIEPVPPQSSKGLRRRRFSVRSFTWRNTANRNFALRAGRAVTGLVASVTALGLVFEAMNHFFHFGTGGC